MISGDRSMLEGKRGAFWHTLEALSKKWNRIDVICPRPNNPAGPTTFFSNVFFHPSPHPLYKQHRWIMTRGLELTSRHSYSVMTAHDYPPFFNGRGARHLSQESGVPYVLEIHHVVGHPVASSVAERIGRMMSRVYLPIAGKRADAIRTVSKATAQTLIKWGVPEAKIHVVPSFYLDVNLPLQVDPRPPVQYDVVFCGRLVANKGVPQILKAIASLPKATLLVIGDGPERKKLQDLARSLTIEHRVEFRGWLPTQRDVLRAMASAKMLVMNSASEGGPRVPLEAMAIGMPVIVTKVGVMPDAIIDGVNGLFTTGEPEDVAANIRRLMENDDLRARLGTVAMEILGRYERSRLIDQYARFLQSFASSAPRP